MAVDRRTMLAGRVYISYTQFVCENTWFFKYEAYCKVWTKQYQNKYFEVSAGKELYTHCRQS
jgi:hypothetical protein